MKTGFFTFDLFHGRKNTGSSRIRCLNLIKYWEKAGLDMGSADEYRYGAIYDAIIFQKAYFPQFLEAYKGIKILDLCDADWLQWNYKLTESLVHCDGVTCSTIEIAKFIVKMTDKPVAVIPDRVDFDTVKKTKEHFDDIKKVAWFGYSDNFEVLEMAIPAIVKRGLELIVVSNKAFSPYKQFRDRNKPDKYLEYVNYPWSPETWADDILRADMVINPKYDKGRFKYKSDNKTTQAWALGLPVALTDKDLDSFASESERRKEAEKRLKEVKDGFDVKQSVTELKDFINEISHSIKKGGVRT